MNAHFNNQERNMMGGRPQKRGPRGQGQYQSGPRGYGGQQRGGPPNGMPGMP